MPLLLLMQTTYIGLQVTGNAHGNCPSGLVYEFEIEFKVFVYNNPSADFSNSCGW
jgi:hypothetical protein